MPWGWRGGAGRSGWFGRGGYGFWAQATGLPGWMRASMGLPAYGRGWFGAISPISGYQYLPSPLSVYSAGFLPGWGRGNPYPFCRFFPWLPRWWWSGMYGPVQWTPQGPVLASQQLPVQQTYPYQTLPSAQRANELDALKQEKQALLNQLKYIEERLKELGR